MIVRSVSRLAAPTRRAPRISRPVRADFRARLCTNASESGTFVQSARLGSEEAGESLFSRISAHLGPLVIWTAVSVQVGTFFSAGDEGVQILIHLDEFTSVVLDPSAEKAKLTERLERVSRGSALNNSLRLRLIDTPGLIERLASFTQGDPKTLGVTAQNHAAKILENVSALPEAQARLVADGWHSTLLEIIDSPRTTLYVKKTLTSAVCNIASHPDALVPLARASTLSVVHDEQESSTLLRRQKVALTLSRLGALIAALPQETLATLSTRERELAASYAEVEAEAAKQPLHQVRSTLIQSGVLLYLHTAAGGAAWGFFESIRLRDTRAQLVQNVVRTSLVTCFVPILLVGGVVTTYTHFNKTTDTVMEKFKLYFTSSMALYPAGRLLQWVERFAPLWLGGHIVGFVSFFAWTLYTESDLLKTDRELGETASKRAA